MGSTSGNRDSSFYCLSPVDTVSYFCTFMDGGKGRQDWDWVLLQQVSWNSSFRGEASFWLAFLLSFETHLFPSKRQTHKMLYWAQSLLRNPWNINSLFVRPLLLRDFHGRREPAQGSITSLIRALWNTLGECIKTSLGYCHRTNSTTSLFFPIICPSTNLPCIIKRR